MNIGRLFIAVSSGFLLMVALVFGISGIIHRPAEAAGSSEAHLEQSVSGGTGLAIHQAITGPTSVSLVPEKLGVAGFNYSFVATVVPTDTTQPISYTWEATGQLPVNHTGGYTDTVSFTWLVSSTQMVTVTAANDWGTATDSYTLFVSDRPPLDVAVALDVSGSTDYATNCFGCWNEDPAKSADIMNNPFPSNGDFNPLDFEGADIFWGGDATPPSDYGANFTEAGHPVCGAAPTPVVDVNGFRYSVHEAEFYSMSFPLNGWEFNKRVPGQGFWVIQRWPRGSNNSYIRSHPFVTYSGNTLIDFPQLLGGTYNSECFTEGQCWKTTGLTIGEVAPNTPPYVEYDFTVDWDSQLQSNTHIWIRAIGGSSWSFQWYGQSAQQFSSWRESIYWQVDGTPFGTDVSGGPFTNLQDMGNGLDRVNNDDWRWVKIANGVDLADGQHTLRIYQGSTGFNLDKIIITNNPDGSINTAVNNNGSIVGGGSLDITSVLSQNSGEGPDATDGSATREACNMCNPTYGLSVNPAQCSCKIGPGDDTVVSPFIYPAGGTGLSCMALIEPTNHLQNDLFRDVEVLRTAQETAKTFATQLDPRLDQIGLLPFNDNIVGREKLQCLNYELINNGNQSACFDPAVDHPETTFNGPISYTRVIQLVEDQIPTGSTNIALGMKESLEELGVSVVGNGTVQHGCTTSENDKESCDRQGAAQRVLILMTDGVPNRFNSASCPSDYHWRGLVGGNTRAYDCAMFFANQAAENDVAVYIIGIGSGVNQFLLAAMAEGQVERPDPSQPCSSFNNNGHPCGDDGFYFEPHCGKYFVASSPNHVGATVEQILTLARGCAQSIALPPLPTPRIWSVNGYAHQPEDTIIVHLEQHEPASIYDIYLKDSSDGTKKYLICEAVATALSGDTSPDPNCSLAAASVPAGSYWLYSTFVLVPDTLVAVADQSVEITAGALPSEQVYLPVIMKQ